MTDPTRHPMRFALTRREASELDHLIARARQVLTYAKGGRAACTAATLRLAIRLRAGTARRGTAC